MIVGKKYFISNKNFEEFKNETKCVGVGLYFINSFKNEKEWKLLKVNEKDGYFEFDCDRKTWVCSAAIKFFTLYKKIIQEEFDV